MEKRTRKEARIVARVSNDIQTTIHKAAAYSGSSVSQFLVDTALEKAKSVINEVEVIKLSEKAAKQMMDLLLNPPAPTTHLLKAKANYRKNINNAKNRSIKSEA